MTANNFPVLCFNQGLVVVAHSDAQLRRCTAAGFRNGWFKNLLVVDAQGVAYKVNAATITPPRVKWLQGLDRLLNPQLMVTLTFEKATNVLTLGDIKSKIRASFHHWHGWSSRGDFEELQAKLEAAASVADIAELVG